MEQSAIEGALGEELGRGVHIEEMRSVSGGSINRAACVRLEGGAEFFVKWNRHPIPDQFEREAEGLSAMADSGTSLAIPRPIVARRPGGSTPAFLIMEYLRPGRRVADFDERLGRGLAEMHRDRDASFGFPHDNYCGATPQPNPREGDWLTFYREHRLRFQIELADTERGWSSAERVLLDRLVERLDEFLVAEDEPPALLHGDLWSGNLHATPEGLPALVDPACYYGHREAELGMMALFGGFSQRVYDAYDEAWPLQAGWRERLDLYSLYHVLNHYNLFGGGYGRQAVDIARQYVG